MAVDRNKLEQQAMRQLQKGQIEQALSSYQQLLRLDPRSRRVRKTVAELHLRLGQNKDAERRFLEIVESLRKDGKERSAIPIYQQLLRLRPKDHEIVDELGDCYRTSSFPTDARKCYEKAVEMTARNKPDKAQEIQLKLVALSPGEFPLRIRHAELLEASNWSERAFFAWVALGKESRRVGRPDEQARFLERAMTLREDWNVLVDAAEARIRMGDPRQGLVHLQKAHAEQQTVRVLALLAEGLQALDQKPKARQLWLQAARLYKEAGEIDRHVRALRGALECSGGQDPTIQAELKEADEVLALRSLRLWEQDWVQPNNQRQVEVVIKAKVEADYGFKDRARQTLEAASDIRKALSARIALAEILVDLGELEAALEELAQVTAPDAAATQQLHLRQQILRGEKPMSKAGDELNGDDLIDDDLIDDDDDLIDDDDELLDDSTDDDDGVAAAHEAEGDRLAIAGRVKEAVAAYRTAIDADPTNDSLLVKLGEMMARLDDEPDDASSDDFSFSFSQGGTFAEISPDDIEDDPEGGFGDGFDDGFDDDFDDEPAEDEALSEARARISVGMFREAVPFLKGRQDLPARTLVAQIQIGVGDLRGARNVLRSALGQSARGEQGYQEAIWTLADLYTQAKKPDAGLKMLDELQEADPSWRKRDCKARRRGLELMLAKG